MPKRQYDTDEDDMFDERGLLKDQHSVRVPMMMRDGLTDLQRSVRDATAPLRVVDAFGNGGLALNKPGARYLLAGKHTPDHAALVMRDHERREARDEYVHRLCDAWKGTDREVARMHNTGDARTDAYLDQKYDLENSWHRGSGKRSQDSVPAARCTMLSRVSASRTRPTAKWSTSCKMLGARRRQNRLSPGRRRQLSTRRAR